MSDNVVKMSDYRYPWKEVFSADGAASTLQVYVNTGTFEVEVIQTNDEGEITRTCLSTVDAVCLLEALKKAKEKIGGDVA